VIRRYRVLPYALVLACLSGLTTSPARGAGVVHISSGEGGAVPSLIDDPDPVPPLWTPLQPDGLGLRVTWITLASSRFALLYELHDLRLVLLGTWIDLSGSIVRTEQPPSERVRGQSQD